MNKQIFNKIIGNSNNKILIGNISYSFILKGLSLLINVLLMPLYINYFNNNIVLGLWFTLIAFFMNIHSFDLGIGNGLRTKLVSAMVVNDHEKINKLISSAYVIIGIISIIILTILIIMYFSSDWNSFFSIERDIISRETLNLTVFIISSGIILNFFLKIVYSILYAMQKTIYPSIMALLSNIMMIVYMLVDKSSSLSESMISLALMRVISLNLPITLLTFYVFFRFFKGHIPSIRNFNFEMSKEIFSLGGKYFLVQLELIIIFTLNEYFITKLFGTQYVVEYQIYYKIFGLIVMLFSLLTQPLWSAFSTAFAEKRFKWVLKVYKIFNGVAFAAGLVAFIIALIFQFIINLWLREDAIVIDHATTYYFAVLVLVMMFVNIATAIANADSKLSCQLICLFIGIVIKVIGSILVSKISSSWNVLVLVNIASLLPLVIAQPLVNIKSIKQKIII